MLASVNGYSLQDHWLYHVTSNYLIMTPLLYSPLCEAHMSSWKRKPLTDLLVVALLHSDRWRRPLYGRPIQSSEFSVNAVLLSVERTSGLAQRPIMTPGLPFSIPRYKKLSVYFIQEQHEVWVLRLLHDSRRCHCNDAIFNNSILQRQGTVHFREMLDRLSNQQVLEKDFAEGSQ